MKESELIIFQTNDGMVRVFQRREVFYYSISNEAQEGPFLSEKEALQQAVFGLADFLSVTLDILQAVEKKAQGILRLTVGEMHE